MRIAVEGCSHGSITTIYDTVAKYTAQTSNPVDLLLLCGDFQALRNVHDFESLAVPQKFRQLGTFHEYYAGKRVAPMLTLVIGGNHEASNYMWELYHGGWLAENIYYLGAGGSVLVNGLRITGASGIYKQHDYTKGHHETVPYNNGTLRSAYHIRQYDVEKLMQLSPRSDTIFLSHDWPITIPLHGDTAALLRRKPFFKQEVQTNTLGSPPLLQLLQHNQPEYWFSAHLHVKFAAVYEHSKASFAPSSAPLTTTTAVNTAPNAKVTNPDEIAIGNDFGTQAGPSGTTHNPDEIEIGDDFDEDNAGPIWTSANPDGIAIADHDFDQIQQAAVPANGEPRNADEIVLDEEEVILMPHQNPDEIDIGNDDFDGPDSDDPSNRQTGALNGRANSAIKDLQVDESADLVEQARQENGLGAAPGIIGTKGTAVMDASSDGTAHNSGRITKFLALDKCGPGKDFIQFLDVPTPEVHVAGQAPRLTFDPEWLAISRVFHPYLSTQHYQIPLPPDDVLKGLVRDELARIRKEGLQVPLDKEEGGVELVWEKGPIDIARVQRFWPTAPTQGLPGGSSSAWYTNPQTEAFCGMLGLPNKVNPAPKA